jgi:hypothetical protein
MSPELNDKERNIPRSVRADVNSESASSLNLSKGTEKNPRLSVLSIAGPRVSRSPGVSDGMTVSQARSAASATCALDARVEQNRGLVKVAGGTRDIHCARFCNCLHIHGVSLVFYCLIKICLARDGDTRSTEATVCRVSCFLPLTSRTDRQTSPCTLELAVSIRRDRVGDQPYRVLSISPASSCFLPPS